MRKHEDRRTTPRLITTTAIEVAGRRTHYIHGVVVGEGTTAVEAMANLEEMAAVYDGSAVVDVLIVVLANDGGNARVARCCAYGTAVALLPE